jgi:glycosyltransferase involved in cell wall biosynthesis
MMKIAVYTIALNEVGFLDSWYESAKDADYLLIADTGSTDGTAESARAMGINVIDISIKPWRFDIARNTALAALPPDIDYCIALDMDEVLVGDWRGELEKAIKQSVTRPRYKYTWSWKDREETVPDLQYGGDKIHLRSHYRWKHPVHEVLVTDRLQEKQEWFDFEIHHHPDTSKPRAQYFPLLELAVKEDPWDDRNAHYYARELFFNGKFKEAFREFKRHISLPSATWAPERAASMRYMAKCSVGKEREKWLKAAIKEAPDRREAMVDLALYYYDEMSWKDCYNTAKKSIRISQKPLEYLVEDFAWGYLPFDLIAISAYYIGQYEEALLYGKKAVSADPKNQRLKDNLDLYESAIIK